MIATTNGSQEGHTITALVEDKPGVLNRITSMFRRRGYNIASLAVGPSEVPRFSRMTFVVEGDPHTLEQVAKNLNKLIDVIKVVDISDDNSVSRELALIRVRWGDQTLSEIKTIVGYIWSEDRGYRSHSLIVEVTGKSNKVDDLVENLTGIGFHVQEVMRTGMVAMSRGLSGNESGRRSQAALPKPKWESGSV